MSGWVGGWWVDGWMNWICDNCIREVHLCTNLQFADKGGTPCNSRGMYYRPSRCPGTSIYLSRVLLWVLSV